MSIFAISVLVLVSMALALYGLVIEPIVRMPGRSFRGALPPWTDSEKALSARLRGHVEMLAGTIGARSLTAAPENLERAATYISQTLTASSLKPERHEFTIVGTLPEKRMADGGKPMKLAGLKTANIVAEIQGTSKPDEIVLVGAHYDSVFDCPAANDNGSGVAAMLELANALAKSKFARTVRLVALTNEEPPFFRSEDMGSTRYARLCREKNHNIVAMLSLETLGCYTDAPGSQKYPKPFNWLYPSKGNFVTFVGNSRSRALVRTCVSAFREAVKFPSEGSAPPEKIPGVDFSDHQGFWQQGYPALMVTDTAFMRYDHYHTDEDTPDKVQYPELARVVCGLEQVVIKLANQ